MRNISHAACAAGNTMPKFCDRLKNLRKSANVTQGELAERMNVHPQTISRWERGITEPDVAQLGELAEALGISVERLLGCDETGESYTGAFSARALGAMIYSLLLPTAARCRRLPCSTSIPSTTSDCAVRQAVSTVTISV